MPVNAIVQFTLYKPVVWFNNRHAHVRVWAFLVLIIIASYRTMGSTHIMIYFLFFLWNPHGNIFHSEAYI